MEPSTGAAAKTPHLRGLVPILATPFQPNGELDLASLRSLVEFQLRSDVDGVAVFGMASEGFALTADERIRILQTVNEVVQGVVPVVAGVNGTSTATAVEQMRGIGPVATYMVLPPFMVKPTSPQLVDFYGDVAEAAQAMGADVMIQDAPGNTGVTMSPELICELGRVANVASVKIEAPPTAPKVRQVARMEGSVGLRILGGQNAQFALEEYASGAVGTMPACEFPDLLGPALQEWEAGDHDAATAAFTRLLPLVLFGLQSGLAWAVHKEVLVARGVIEHATVRLPARDLDAGGRASLGEILRHLGLPAGALLRR